MWRFIFVTFAFLGSAFYFLSGGADYAPVPNSIQARAQTEGSTLFAWPAPTPKVAQARRAKASLDTADATGNNTVSRAAASLNDLSLAAKAQAGAVRLHLASADSHQFSAPQPPRATSQPGKATSTATAHEVTATSMVADVRKVTGSSVNMRSGPGTKFGRLAHLKGGTRVAVLRDPGNGWLKIRALETGRVGWMADWLVTASAN